MDKSATEYNAFDLIAKHYRVAAENELPDKENGTIYWWAYAATLAQSGIGTLGELPFVLPEKIK